MIGLSRSPGIGHVSSETDREDSPPPAPDVTAVSIFIFCQNFFSCLYNFNSYD